MGGKGVCEEGAGQSNYIKYLNIYISKYVVLSSITCVCVYDILCMCMSVFIDIKQERMAQGRSPYVLI